jgi:hypothetical protein
MIPGACTPGFLARPLQCSHGGLGQTRRRDFSPNRAKSSLSGSESGSQSASTFIAISDGPARLVDLHSDIDSDTEGRTQLHPAEVEQISPGREPRGGTRQPGEVRAEGLQKGPWCTRGAAGGYCRRLTQAASGQRGSTCAYMGLSTTMSTLRFRLLPSTVAFVSTGRYSE